MRKEWSELTRQELFDLYAKLPATAIAAKYDVTFGAVYHKLRVYGLDCKAVGKHRPGPKRRFNPPKEELERLYGSLSMRKIADHYGVGETVIFHRLKQNGIGGITRSMRLKEYKKTPEHIAKIASKLTQRRGPLAGNWRGGVSSQNKLGRTRIEARGWKMTVLRAANFKCSVCGIEQGSICKCCGSKTLLHAHHIKSYADYPALRYDPKNGIALCDKCHHEQHYKETRLVPEHPTK